MINKRLIRGERREDALMMFRLTQRNFAEGNYKTRNLSLDFINDGVYQYVIYAEFYDDDDFEEWMNR